MAMWEVKGDLGDEMERWMVGHGEEVDIDHVLEDGGQLSTNVRW